MGQICKAGGKIRESVVKGGRISVYQVAESCQEHPHPHILDISLLRTFQWFPSSLRIIPKLTRPSMPYPPAGPPSHLLSCSFFLTPLTPIYPSCCFSSMPAYFCLWSCTHSVPPRCLEHSSSGYCHNSLPSEFSSNAISSEKPSLSNHPV